MFVTNLWQCYHVALRVWQWYNFRFAQPVVDSVPQLQASSAAIFMENLLKIQAQLFASSVWFSISIDIFKKKTKISCANHYKSWATQNDSWNLIKVHFTEFLFEVPRWWFEVCLFQWKMVRAMKANQSIMRFICHHNENDFRSCHLATWLVRIEWKSILNSIHVATPATTYNYSFHLDFAICTKHF